MRDKYMSVLWRQGGRAVYDILSGRTGRNLINYTIPSDNRELQQSCYPEHVKDDYTIPSDNRELQL